MENDNATILQQFHHSYPCAKIVQGERNTK